MAEVRPTSQDELSPDYSKELDEITKRDQMKWGDGGRLSHEAKVRIAQLNARHYIPKEAVAAALQRSSHNAGLLIDDYRSRFNVDRLAPVGYLRIGIDEVRQALNLDTPMDDSRLNDYLQPTGKDNSNSGTEAKQ